MRDRDWQAIERDYVAGTQSVRALALRHELSESTIRKRAKRLGWRRGQHSPAPPLHPILAKHRRAIERLNGLHDELGTKAADLVEAAQSLRELADAAASVERLGRIAERVISLERQAFGLDDASAATVEDDGLAAALRKARERAGLPPG